MTSNDFTHPTPKMAHTHPADHKACQVAKARYLIPKNRKKLSLINDEYSPFEGSLAIDFTEWEQDKLRKNHGWEGARQNM
ncbi:hypothetical protein RUM44_004313 [Polyplax serrata]|uniref:Uncharacterized protein n=1 Tax=Polyplax serrata TaxID=468196 RepID=A0ABR1B359_POLSC